jgi:hypothetical protein
MPFGGLTDGGPAAPGGVGGCAEAAQTEEV